jgi:hypothetical protein
VLIEHHKALQEYQELQRQGAAEEGDRPQRPSLQRPRLFMNGRWEKKGYVSEMHINGWRTAHLRGDKAEAARVKRPSRIIESDQDRGDKRVQARSFYIRRSDSDGEGLCMPIKICERALWWDRTQAE